MFDFLSCGFGSVLGGLLTALMIAGALLAYSTQSSRRGTIEPLPLILCGILFCLLFYQTTLMYAAVGNKGIAMDFISACHLQFGDDIKGEELKEQMTILIRENPLFAFYIDYSDLENFDWSQPFVSLRSAVAREYNWYIFRRVVWSLVFITVILALILLTSNGKKSRMRHARTDSNNNFDRDYY